MNAVLQAPVCTCRYSYSNCKNIPTLSCKIIPFIVGFPLFFLRFRSLTCFKRLSVAVQASTTRWICVYLGLLLHAFQNSVLEVSPRFYTPVSLRPEKELGATHVVWASHSWTEHCGGERNFCSGWRSNPDSPVVQTVACHCTDWDILACVILHAFGVVNIVSPVLIIFHPGLKLEGFCGWIQCLEDVCYARSWLIICQYHI